MVNPVVQLHTADTLLLNNTKTLIFIISEFLNIQVLRYFSNLNAWPYKHNKFYTSIIKLNKIKNTLELKKYLKGFNSEFFFKNKNNLYLFKNLYKNLKRK